MADTALGPRISSVISSGRYAVVSVIEKLISGDEQCHQGSLLCSFVDAHWIPLRRFRCAKVRQGSGWGRFAGILGFVSMRISGGLVQAGKVCSASGSGLQGGGVNYTEA